MNARRTSRDVTARLTTLTDYRINELRDILIDAGHTPQDWNHFLEAFVSDPDIHRTRHGKDLR